jgi:hypothetical protein
MTSSELGRWATVTEVSKRSTRVGLQDYFTSPDTPSANPRFLAVPLDRGKSDAF